MKFSRQPAVLASLPALSLFAVLAFSVSCGGGGGSSGPPPPPPPPPSPISITTSTLADGIVGTSYSVQLQATGGTPPYTWSMSAFSSPLPNGLTISGTGLLSGTPAQSVFRNIAFEVRDTGNRTASNSFAIAVYDRLAITSTSLPYGILTRDYFQPLSATGGKQPYTWSLISGSTLPPGVNLTTNGFLAGTLNTAGSFSFTVQLADGLNQVLSQPFTVDVFSGPLITASPVQLITISGQPFTYTLQATGGTPPYIWDVPNPIGGSNNILPAGLVLSSNGVLSGTTPNIGLAGFSIRVTDAAGHADGNRFTLLMVQPLSLGPAIFPDGNVGISYSRQIPLIGGRGPYSWSLAAGSGPLPPGVGFGNFFDILGTPSAPGSFTFTVEVQDSVGQLATQIYSILIKNDIIITTPGLAYSVLNYAYPQQSLTAVGGTPPYTWNVVSGALPPGLSMDPATSLITGTSTADGNFLFDIQATDSANPPQVGVKPFAILIRPPLAITSTFLPDAVVFASYGNYVRADGGRFPPYTIRLTSGAFPSGISFNSLTSDSSGAFFVTGSPVAPGVSNFTVEVSDSSSPPATVTKDFSIRANLALLIDPGTGSLASIIEGQPFSYTVSATGGVPPYTWSLQSPIAGMSIDPSTGVFSGAPSQRVVYGVTFNAEDSANPPQHASRFMTWYVAELMRVRTSFFPTLAAGAPVNIMVSVTGGCCGYDWSISSGSLPPGLRLLSSQIGEILGTPTTTGTYNFTLLLKDGAAGPLAQSLSKPMSIVVKAQGQLGRNDSIATATPLSNGIFIASISPADDGFGALNPDNDYYAITAYPGAVVTIEAAADGRNVPFSAIDTVIEILDAAGTRHSTCNTNGLSTFPNPCMNDDQYVGNSNSKLYFQVPGAPGGPPVTFYVRVLDWSGMARPDFFYAIIISGAN